MVRLLSALVVLAGALVAVVPLSLRSAMISDTPVVDVAMFYAVTAGAYGLLPFVRRGDIVMVAMWLVLGIGVAPCFMGHELSAEHMFGGMAGVLMAAGPVYIARFRQVAQGDIRFYHRRTAEAGAFLQGPVQGPAQGPAQVAAQGVATTPARTSEAPVQRAPQIA